MDTLSIVNERYAFGKYPYPPEIEVKELESLGYNIFLDLTTAEEDLIEYREYLSDTTLYFSLPITDRKTPKSKCNVKTLVDRIVDKLKDGDKVFIHCRGGHGRSGMMAAIFLMVDPQYDFSPSDALLAVQDAHSQRKVIKPKFRRLGSPQTKRQKQFVLDF